MQVLEVESPVVPVPGRIVPRAAEAALRTRHDMSLRLPEMDVFDPNLLIGRIARKQDQEAFAALFGHFAPRLKSFLIRRGESPEAAEDLAQETMVRMWHRAGSFDPARAELATWLFAIARNLKIDTFRHDRRAALNADDFLLTAEEPARPEDILIGSEARDRVQLAMKSLPAEQLDLVRLSFFEGHSHGEIADLIGIPLGTVKSRLRLAFARLREKLGDIR